MELCNFFIVVFFGVLIKHLDSEYDNSWFWTIDYHEAQ